MYKHKIVNRLVAAMFANYDRRMHRRALSLRAPPVSPSRKPGFYNQPTPSRQRPLVRVPALVLQLRERREGARAEPHELLPHGLDLGRLEGWLRWCTRRHRAGDVSVLKKNPKKRSVRTHRICHYIEF